MRGLINIKIFLKKIFSVFQKMYKTRVFLYIAMFILFLFYALFKFLIKKDYSFETTHTLFFYLTLILVFIIFVESFIRDRKLTLSVIYFILLSTLYLLFINQVDYI